MFDLALLQSSGVLPVDVFQILEPPLTMPALGQNPDANTLPPPNK